MQGCLGERKAGVEEPLCAAESSVTQRAELPGCELDVLGSRGRMRALVIAPALLMLTSSWAIAWPVHVGSLPTKLATEVNGSIPPVRCSLRGWWTTERGARGRWMVRC